MKIETAGGLGSGVIINANCALTAKHVVKGEKGLKIVTIEKKEYEVTRVVEAEFSDLAVVCGKEDLGHPPVRIRTTMPKLFSPVFILGFPLGIENYLTTGQYEGDDMVSAPVVWGNSGGGVFDQAGNLIGIAIALRVQRIESYVFVFPHLAIIATIRDVTAFLDENHIPFQPAL